MPKSHRARWSTEESCRRAAHEAAWLEAACRVDWPIEWKWLLANPHAADSSSLLDPPEPHVARVAASGAALIKAIEAFLLHAEEAHAAELQVRHYVRAHGGPVGREGDDGDPLRKRLLEVLDLITLRVRFAEFDLGAPVTASGRKQPHTLVRKRAAVKMLGTSTKGVAKPTARDLALAVCGSGHVDLPAGWRSMTPADVIEREANAMREYLPNKRRDKNPREKRDQRKR